MFTSVLFLLLFFGFLKMLQVLCQILQTDSLVDVQSWLVSSSGQGKNISSR